MAALSPLDMLEQDIQQIHDVRPPLPEHPLHRPRPMRRPENAPFPNLRVIMRKTAPHRFTRRKPRQLYWRARHHLAQCPTHQHAPT